MNSERGTALALCTLLLAGCSTTPERVDQSFGNAARNMTAVQHFEPPARARAYDGTGINGAQAERAYRTWLGEQPASTADPIQVEIKNISKADR